MWRPFARRALLHRRPAAAKSRPASPHLPANHHETVTPPPPSIQSASRFSLLSRKSHFCQNPRFFSSNPAENYEDTPSEPPISETSEIKISGFDFSAMNVFGGSEKSDLDNEDSIFDDVVGDLNPMEGFGGIVDGSVALDVNLDPLAAAEDGGIIQVRENDREKVENLLSLLQSSGIVTESLETKLEGMNLVLDEGLALKVLETPYVPGENLIGFFRWIVKKPEFLLTTGMLDALVSAICGENNRRTETYVLWDLVREVGEKEKGVVSTEILNKLIAEFSRLGKGKAAFDAFNKFEEFGCISNADTYYLTIEALCKRSFYEWASLVCEKMLSADMLPGVERVGKIISYLCRGDMTKDAHLVYLYAKDKKIQPPQSSIDFLVSSLSRVEKTDKETYQEINKELDRETVSLALEVLTDYSSKDRKYAIKPFSSVVRKLCWIEDVDRAKKLLLEMIDSGPPPGNAVFNCVINGLTKTGDMKEALNVMKLMESRGLRPDVYTYSVVMSGFARNGEMEEACKIFDEAKKNHSKLAPVTYHTLIRGFCKLEQFEKAVSLVREMKQHGVKPTHDEYNKLIKSLCFKALDWETAEKLQEEMMESGVILNGRTRALISAIKELQEGASSEISASA